MVRIYPNSGSFTGSSLLFNAHSPYGGYWAPNDGVAYQTDEAHRHVAGIIAGPDGYEFLPIQRTVPDNAPTTATHGEYEIAGDS